MSDFTPENPFGINDQESAPQRLLGKIAVFGISSAVALGSAYAAKRVPEGEALYALTVGAEGVSLFNAFGAASLAQDLARKAVLNFLRIE